MRRIFPIPPDRWKVLVRSLSADNIRYHVSNNIPHVSNQQSEGEYMSASEYLLRGWWQILLRKALDSPKWVSHHQQFFFPTLFYLVIKSILWPAATTWSLDTDFYFLTNICKSYLLMLWNSVLDACHEYLKYHFISIFWEDFTFCRI